MIFYTSDIHFFDEKIRIVCGRPFESVEEMNQTIMQNWNSKVRPADTTYILGDVMPCTGGDVKAIMELAGKLNGNKILIAGNHDEEYLPDIVKSCVFKDIRHIAKIQDAGKELVLFHYPMMSWMNDENGSIHLYGHIHNKKLTEIFRYYDGKKAFNVGLDVRHFVPVSLGEILGGKYAHIY